MNLAPLETLRGDYTSMASDWTVPQRATDYSDEDQAVWRLLVERQTALRRDHPPPGSRFDDSRRRADQRAADQHTAHAVTLAGRVSLPDLVGTALPEPPGVLDRPADTVEQPHAGTARPARA